MSTHTRTHTHAHTRIKRSAPPTAALCLPTCLPGFAPRSLAVISAVCDSGWLLLRHLPLPAAAMQLACLVYACALSNATLQRPGQEHLLSPRLLSLAA
jgi:hypothetical protein